MRAGYSRSYTRLGLTDFTGQVGNNPGVSLNVFRQQALGNLGRAAAAAARTEPPRTGGFPGDAEFTRTREVVDRGHHDLQPGSAGAVSRIRGRRA